MRLFPLILIVCCATAEASVGQALSFVAIADKDLTMTRPSLPNDLDDDTGSSGAVESAPVGTVTVYVRADCAPCRTLKRDVKNYSGLTFIFRDASDGMDAPTLEWQAQGATWTQVGWTGLQSFVNAYNASIKPKVQQSSTVRSYNTSGYGARWTHPGNTKAGIIEHLMNDGIHRGKFSRSTLEGMSYQRLEALHANDHEGRAIVSSMSTTSTRTTKKRHRESSRTRVRYRTSCPDGKC